VTFFVLIEGDLILSRDGMFVSTKCPEELWGSPRQEADDESPTFRMCRAVSVCMVLTHQGDITTYHNFVLQVFNCCMQICKKNM
jgi:hypothetical protein